MSHNNCKDIDAWKTCWEEGVIDYIYLKYTAAGLEAPGGQSDQMKEIEAEQKAACAIEYDCDYPAIKSPGEHVVAVAGDPADADPIPSDYVADEASPLYEYWNIGYLTADSFDSNGLVNENNFNLNYGTYIVLDADGNIYDAATFKGNVGTPAATAAEAGISSIDSNLDASMLTDEELSGISSFEIREILRDDTDDDYFIVSWAYGDTARPEFSLGDPKTAHAESTIYDVSYNGDKKPIKDTYKLASKSGINGFKEGYENLVSDIINSVIDTTPSTTDPIFSFKKLRRKKIDCTELTIFKELESGTVTATTVATTVTTSGY